MMSPDAIMHPARKSKSIPRRLRSTGAASAALNFFRVLRNASKRKTVMRRLIICLIPLCAFAGQSFAQTAPATAQEPAKSAPAPKNDYGNGDSWLCRPARQDACAVDLSTTVISASGKLTREDWSANHNAPIDCFYVYPTVSSEPSGNSDMLLGPEEKGVVRAQFARFASVCRAYA